MPIVRADRSSRRALLGVIVALVLVASACTGRPDTAPSGVTPTQPGPPTSSGRVESSPPVVEGLPVPPDLDAAFGRLLDRRAQAVLDRDREAFLSVLTSDDDGFLVAQEGYFDNLVQLPLARFGYEVDPASLVRGRGSYSVVVVIEMQLDGFDALPVRTLDRFRFDRVGKPRKQRYRLASVTDREWESLHKIRSQPWEVRPIQVRRGAGILAVFDDTSVADADQLLRGLERSVSDVAARVPYAWDRSVVVYALSDTAFIRSLDDLPGEDPDALDGISFTVSAGPGDPRIAATRIVLNPRISTRSRQVRERLLRHELTHVAVGERDDNAPVWLSEGLAEWVSVQALPERRRRLDAEALQAAREGVSSLPEAATFNDDDAPLHYALSWWVCEYLAATYGEAAPWTVLDSFAVPGIPEGPTLQALLQISGAKLAKRAAALLVRTYSPRDRPARTPTQPAGETPTGTPTVEPSSG